MDDPRSSGNHPAMAGASIVVIRRDAVLMVKRANPPAKGRWSFPAGRAEPGEDPEMNARRELSEETGLKVGRLVRIGDFRPQGASIHITVFAAQAAKGTPRAGDDATEAEFVPFSSVLMRPLTAGAAGWIARAILALSDLPPP